MSFSFTLFGVPGEGTKKKKVRDASFALDHLQPAGRKEKEEEGTRWFSEIGPDLESTEREAKRTSSPGEKVGRRRPPTLS